MKEPITFIRDDDTRRLVVALDKVATGLRDLEAAPTLDDHPAIQYDLRNYTDVIKRAADFLADLRENGHR
jgi:hypothetical protein